MRNLLRRNKPSSDYQLATFQLARTKLGDNLYQDSGRRTKRNRLVARQYAPVDTMQIRAELKNVLSELQREGMVPVYEWQRDCDQCEGDSVSLIPATVMAYVQYEESIFSHAEGPARVYPISYEEYAEYKPYFCDRRAHQYNY